MLGKSKGIRKRSLRNLKPDWQPTKQLKRLSKREGVKRGNHSLEARAETTKDDLIPSRLRGPEDNPHR